MTNKWTTRFMELAQLVATWSKDPSTKVGAVIIDADRRVLGVGYNGFPRGIHDTATRYEHKDAKYDFVVHAEVNAILNSSLRPEGASMYSTYYPCADCAGIIIQSGIRRVIAPKFGEDLTWRNSWLRAQTMFREANVKVLNL